VPEIHENRSTPQAGESDILAVQQSQGEIGSGLPCPGRLGLALGHQIRDDPAGDEDESSKNGPRDPVRPGSSLLFY
jgi:hypothetical protein